jgi:predicted Rossmann fold flavoprotein
MQHVAVIGGGAAGFFAALSVKEHHPDAQVTIYEKSKKTLAKVKISGGGRCNVTNGTRSISDLTKAYPRGGKQLKKLFNIFNTKHTEEWFETRGVPLMTQDDNCVFPVSQDSQSIIDCFENTAKDLGITIKLSHSITQIEELDGKLNLHSPSGTVSVDKVIVATGGSPKARGLTWLGDLGHQIVTPVPSLFTFNMPSESVTELMGVVVEHTLTTIEGEKLQGDGPLLITHWGMSGPAILKLSAYGARVLADKDYQFNVQVNWVNEKNQEKVKIDLLNIKQSHPKKLLQNYRPSMLPSRLWLYLLQKCDLPQTKQWHELGKNGINKLVTTLTNDRYQVSGKTTFKEEFVTAGGVSLDSVNMKTMESKVIKNLYFAGEVLDIDGITGGYNFQSAWTTGYVAGRLG